MPEENRYKPPDAPVGDTGLPPQRSLTVGVLAGLAVGVGGAMVSRVILGTVYVGLRGVPQSAEALSAMLSSAFIPSLSLGCVFSVLSGYVRARRAAWWQP